MIRCLRKKRVEEERNRKSSQMEGKENSKPAHFYCYALPFYFFPKQAHLNPVLEQQLRAGLEATFLYRHAFVWFCS